MQHENFDQLIERIPDISEIKKPEEFSSEYIHSSFKKNDLHDYFKYINGFIDTDFANCPEENYIGAKPEYEKHAELIELFKQAFKKIRFFVKTSVGDVNATNTRESLNIDGQFPLPLIIKNCGSVLMPLFNSNIEGSLPTVDQLKIKIVDLLCEYAEIIEDDEKIDDDDEDQNLLFLNENYNWKERCNDLAVELIVDEMQKNNKKKHYQKSFDQKEVFTLSDLTVTFNVTLIYYIFPYN